MRVVIKRSIQAKNAPNDPGCTGGHVIGSRSGGGGHVIRSRSPRDPIKVTDLRHALDDVIGHEILDRIPIYVTH